MVSRYCKYCGLVRQFCSCIENVYDLLRRKRIKLPTAKNIGGECFQCNQDHPDQSKEIIFCPECVETG